MSTADGDLTPAVWRALRHQFLEALDEMGRSTPFTTLRVGERMMVVMLLAAWLRGEDTPTQASFAAKADLSIRSVRRGQQKLEDLAIVRALPVLGGTTQLVPGAALIRFLKEFAFGRDVQIWSVRGTPGVAHTPANRPEGITGTPDNEHDRIAGAPANATYVPRRPRTSTPSSALPLASAITTTVERIRVHPPPASSTQAPPARETDPLRAATAVSLKEEKTLTTSSSFSDKAEPTRATRPAVVHADTHRRVACQALAAHFARARPGAPLPRSFDVNVVAMVMRTVADCNGDEPALLQKQLDAIDGAFARSAHRAPTATYIWRELEHFHRHLAHGREMRPASKPPRKPTRTRPEEPCADPAWLARHLKERIPLIDPLYPSTRPDPVHTHQE